MVKDHISRDAALSELQRVYDLLSGYHPSFYAGFQFAVKALESIQATDVAPVVHGRWEFKRTFGFENIYVCTVCGRVVRDSKDDAQMKEHYPYCHCGARMDLEERNGKA